MPLEGGELRLGIAPDAAWLALIGWTGELLEIAVFTAPLGQLRHWRYVTGTTIVRSGDRDDWIADCDVAIEQLMVNPESPAWS